MQRVRPPPQRGVAASLTLRQELGTSGAHEVHKIFSQVNACFRKPAQLART